MKVSVGSLNPTKIEGARRALLRLYSDVEIAPISVRSKVPAQPFGRDTIKGAIWRATSAFSQDVELSIGIEAGLFECGSAGGYLDFQVAAVFDGTHHTMGFGPGFAYPPSVIEEVLEGKEVGVVMERISGIKGLGERGGAVHFLSRGAISRVELSEMAVLMAMIPRIRGELYG